MRPFVALQVAFSLVVLFVGGLLVLSFVRLTRVNPGFAASNVLLLSWEAVDASSRMRRAALVRVLDRLRDVPGVAAVSAADFNLIGRAWTHGFPVPNTEYDWIEATMAPVTPGSSRRCGSPSSPDEFVNAISRPRTRQVVVVRVVRQTLLRR